MAFFKQDLGVEKKNEYIQLLGDEEFSILHLLNKEKLVLESKEKQGSLEFKKNSSTTARSFNKCRDLA